MAEHTNLDQLLGLNSMRGRIVSGDTMSDDERQRTAALLRKQDVAIANIVLIAADAELTEITVVVKQPGSSVSTHIMINERAKARARATIVGE